jgi:hypothetical protein
MIVKMVAESFGALLAPNLVLLLYPVTRGSVVLQALRLPYPEAIRWGPLLAAATAWCQWAIVSPSKIE